MDKKYINNMTSIVFYIIFINLISFELIQNVSLSNSGPIFGRSACSQTSDCTKNSASEVCIQNKCQCKFGYAKENGKNGKSI